MKTTFAGMFFLIMIFFLAGGFAHAVQLNQPEKNSQLCSSICSYERLGIKSYVNACMMGCTLYQNTYYESGDQNSSLATCKAGCPSMTRNICEYGCNAAKSKMP